MTQNFTGNFTQQEPLPEEAIEAAVAVMRHGRLHRYNLSDGEAGETALLEQEFAAYTGAKYCVAVASGGYALAAALRAAGAKAGDTVLTNAFTLAPVPGAIANAGCEPVFVEVTDALVMDLKDLQVKITSSGAKFLMLSHMRGHLVDMDALMQICNAADVKVIEDCAHTMGASWDGVPSGRHGVAGCYSTQTFKHLNSGEGGLLITDDADLAARAIMLSGSYMLFERNGAGPEKEVFDQIKLETPNCSGRMDNLRAAILRPQLRNLDAQCQAWNDRYKRVENGLRNATGIQVIERPEKEQYVMSSFQFLCPDLSNAQMIDVQKRTANRGVELKWFGADSPVGFTSRHDSWKYVAAQNLPETDRILAGLFDMRLPLTFTLEDCDLLATIIREEVGAVYQTG
ncbi:aminotransferase class I/II-fold pyridoxal phosphate-dependent enzyme [Amylibacter sp. IMCC11727]|uniref:DegT/DnrJ/EryC1/StrS family aminotransferase n=1 Tax=Amylibacter sp. IMCC11727 TaxID=3039851 RepID=UPI00244DFB17|nr:aminotransferase class I/II-fold pyridoxal phosphate-dependent enzyme [Amylibacter sp. IMCC11727]WGI23380.1 aminotransferase class I/II-fold pyridoxal phosphate-dependent enzyme [Amylibacter sp. IMCC11727]